MLFYGGSFSYTPCAVLYGEFRLHSSCCFLWGVFLTLPVLFSVGVCFTCPMLFWACGEFLLKNPFYFMWGVSLTRPMLLHVGSYTPHAMLYGEFLLHIPCCFMWEVSLTYPMLCYMGSFSYMPHAVLCREFLLHTPCSFMWGVSLTHPMLFYVGSFSYTPHAILCGEFLLHTPAILLLHVYTLSCTIHSSFDTRMLEIEHYKRKTRGFRTLDPTFGIHSHKTLGTAQPCHLLNV